MRVIFSHYFKTKVTFTVSPGSAQARESYPQNYHLPACKFQARTRPGPQNIIEAWPGHVALPMGCGPARPMHDPTLDHIS